MDLKRTQFHREKHSAFILRALVFCFNNKTIVLFLIETSKTIFAQYCIHLDELSFKMLEKFLYLNAILTIKDQVKSAGKDTAQYEYKQDALTICQALNVIFIPQMLWGIVRALLCQRLSRNFILLLSWLADFLITAPFR